jgi:hypothetical protein
VTEDEYIVATTLARVYAIRDLLSHVMADERWVTDDDRKIVGNITSNWERRLQKHCVTD